MTKSYRFIHDAGHGWVEVKLDELKRLDLINHITGYSYISEDKRTVFLEEDYDLMLFNRAKKFKDDEDVQFCHEYVNGDCFVKELPRYNLSPAHLRAEDIEAQLDFRMMLTE